MKLIVASPSFQRVNRPFVLSFENETGRRGHATYYLLKVEIKDYNVKTNDQSFFNQPVKIMKKEHMKTYQGHDYTTRCLLDYPCFKENNKLIEADVSKQELLDSDPRVIEQINFTGNLGL